MKLCYAFIKNRLGKKIIYNRENSRLLVSSADEDIEKDSAWKMIRHPMQLVVMFIAKAI